MLSKCHKDQCVTSKGYLGGWADNLNSHNVSSNDFVAMIL